MKFFLSFLVVGVFAAVCYSASVQHGSSSNLSVGSVRPGDVLLERKQILQHHSHFTQSYFYIYRGDIGVHISAVRAYDNYRSEHASAYLYDGGVGYNNVTIRLLSERGHGLNYTIDVYGR